MLITVFVARSGRAYKNLVTGISMGEIHNANRHRVHSACVSEELSLARLVDVLTSSVFYLPPAKINIAGGFRVRVVE